MYELLIVLIILLFAVNKTREHLYLGTTSGFPFLTMDRPKGQTEIISTFPDACPPHRSENGWGFCYRPCPGGYRREGAICVLETHDRGVGRAVGLEPCHPGWTNAGLICVEPIKCGEGWNFFKEGCSGGRWQGRLNGGGICDYPSDLMQLPNWLREFKDDAIVYKGTNREVPEELIGTTEPEKMERKRILVASHPDKKDGLCYRRCPKDKPHTVPGMPFLCCHEDSCKLLTDTGVGTPGPLIRFFEMFSFPWW